ncbi:MAG: hypothetical protein J5950_08555 [Clostridia bacterium]|nr:hypothetical protein [Clostridia bacterium]
MAAYAAISLFLLIFGAVYEHFSHGIETPFMRFAFVIPLAMGAGAAGMFLIFKKLRRPGKYPRSIYRWSCACLTAASLLKGVFFIYGTDSIFPLVYLIAGMVCLIAAVAAYFAGSGRGKNGPDR